MFDLLCVTNRQLCQDDFLRRIEEIAKQHPAGIILREKDLTEGEYRLLAEEVHKICTRQGTMLIFHSFIDVAREQQAKAIHLPPPLLRKMTEAEKDSFSVIGASCHSADEAMEAEALGCTYLTVGHIFATDCKKGLPGRGLDFLTQVVNSVSLPVYAIGGIGIENIGEIKATGAAGACLMSGLMQCADVANYVQSLRLI